MASAVIKHHKTYTDVENFRQFGAIILGGRRNLASKVTGQAKSHEAGFL